MNRQSIRYRGYDYASIGYYFITITTYEQRSYFGKIEAGKMHCNAIGKIVAEEWKKSESLRKNITLHEFVVMPDHFHGIIEIQRAIGANRAGEFRSPSHTVGSIVRGFKGAVTRRVRTERTDDRLLSGMEISSLNIWHRNYYDRIIRDRNELFWVKRYIENNPMNWKK